MAPRDVESLADRLEWMDGHRAELATMGAAAAQRVQEAYSVQRLVLDFRAIYARLGT